MKNHTLILITLLLLSTLLFLHQTSFSQSSTEEVFRLTRILLDDDKEEAFLFLKQCLKPQLDQATRGHLVRSFEGP